jgi:hypothetical protein
VQAVLWLLQAAPLTTKAVRLELPNDESRVRGAWFKLKVLKLLSNTACTAEGNIALSAIAFEKQPKFKSQRDFTLNLLVNLIQVYLTCFPVKWKQHFPDSSIAQLCLQREMKNTQYCGGITTQQGPCQTIKAST